jgi:cytochrome c oxidase subunit 2
MNTAIEPPRGVWWKPAERPEKLWVGVAFAWSIVLFAMMPIWHLKGAQNPSGTSERVDPAAFQARATEFIEAYRIGEESGIPVVEPPPGSDIYLVASMWRWTPVLKLRKDAEYTLHLSSLDVNHGFSLLPVNMNFQVVPGYDYALRIRPTEAGDFRIVCNEFCGIGHHNMVGRLIVVDGEGETAVDAGGER